MTHKNLTILKRFVERYRGKGRDRDFDKVFTTNMLLSLLEIADAADHIFQSLDDKKKISTESAVRSLDGALDKIRKVSVG